MDLNDILTEKSVEIIIENGIKNVSKVFDTLYKSTIKAAKKKLKRDEFEEFKEIYNFQIEEEKVLNQIKHNIQVSLNWASEINFGAALKSKSLKKVFVDIDLYLSPLKNRFDVDEKTKTISSKKIFEDIYKNIIIYGGAGAGKTTLLKNFYLEFLNSENKNNFSCPLMIRFREIDYDKHYKNENFGLYKILVDILGIEVNFPHKYNESFPYEYYNSIKQTILNFFNNTNILLVADGFDEIPDLDLKKRIEKEFEELSLSLIDSKFIMTSRSNDFNLKLNNTDTFEICPLNDKQIKSLIKKWLNSPTKSEDLFQKIKISPFYDTSIRPLTLSHLCAIYERKKNIPDKPKYVYDFVVKLLLEDWDQERNITRPSNYANFYIEKKKDFLSHLSFWLTYHLNKNVFNSDDIRKCYNDIYISHDLPKSQAKKVVLELENHTGLLVQVGYDYFQFSHKSLQEYLTAKYISQTPKIPEFDIIQNLPNELAICVSLSSQPNIYFEYFINSYMKFDSRFWDIFFTRLVDEKPDFDNSHYALLFFFIYINKNKDENSLVTFTKLIETTNIARTYRQFEKFYNKNSTYENEIEYLFKDLNIPLDRRSGQPGRIFISKDLIGKIKDSDYIKTHY